MRAFFSLVFATLTVAIIVIAAVPFVVSTQWIRDQATEAVYESTGRELIIAGDASFSVFPNISLLVSNATLSNPQGREGDFADMEELDLGLKLVPLFSGRVEVDRLIVTRPVITLEVDANGAPNWLFAPVGESSTPAQPSEGEVAQAPLSPAETLPTIESIQIGDMRLIDGTVTFTDRRNGSAHEFEQINATIGLSSLDNPLNFDGTGVWQGEEIGFSLDLLEPRALATGTPSTASLGIESAHLQAAFSGSVELKSGLVAKGDIEASSPSLKQLARWLGALAPQVDGLGTFSIAASMSAGTEEIALSSARLTLDEANAEGGFLVSLSGPRPLVQATLAVDRIDVNRYLAGGSSTSSAPQAPSSPQGEGVAAGGWDAEPINVDGLRTLDADVRLSTAELLFHELRAGQSALAVTLREGILTVDLSELQLYEGRAVGKLTVNGAGEMPAIAASFTVDNVAARQILNASAGLDWLDGRGQISGSLASRGLTHRRLVEALNGEMNVRFTDGAIRGFNISQLMRNLNAGAVFDWSREEAQQTDFSELSADFTIAKGIAQTDNLLMLSPLVRLNSVGVANLPRRTVDFRINPKIVASLEGQGGAEDLSGIEIPFMVTGSFDNPTITPDLAAVLRDPQKTINTIEQIGRSLEELRDGRGGDGIKGAIQGLTGDRQPKEFLDLLVGGGGGNAQPGQDGAEPQAPPPITEDLFKQILGQ